MRQTRSMLVVAFVLGVAALTGCGGTKGAAQPQATQTVHQIDVLWVVLYHDLKSLRQNADIVVAGEIAGVAHVTHDQEGLAFTDFTFHIDQVILDPKQLVTGPTLLVHQTGGTVGNDRYEVRDDPLFQQGEAAILFLRQFDPGTGQATPGQYVVIGGPSGRFELRNGRVTPVNDEGVQFSAPMTEADFMAAIQSA